MLSKQLLTVQPHHVCIVNFLKIEKIYKIRGGREGERDRHMEGLRRASVTQSTGKVETRGGTNSKDFANNLNLNKSLGQGRGDQKVKQTLHCY